MEDEHLTFSSLNGLHALFCLPQSVAPGRKSYRSYSRQIHVVRMGSSDSKSLAGKFEGRSERNQAVRKWRMPDASMRQTICDRAAGRPMHLPCFLLTTSGTAARLYRWTMIGTMVEWTVDDCMQRRMFSSTQTMLAAR